LNRERCIEILRNDFNIKDILPNSKGWVKVRCVLPGHNDKHPSAAFNLNNGVYSCIDENTLLQTDLGIKKIKDIEIGEMIYDENGELQQIENKFSRMCKKDELYKLNIKGMDSPLYITDDHKILVMKIKHCSKSFTNIKWCKENCHQIRHKRGCAQRFYKEYKEEWITIKELLNENFAVKAIFPKLYGEGISLDLAYILGYYCAEGSFDHTRLDFAAHLEEKEFLENEFIPKLKRVFGDKINPVIVQTTANGIHLRVSLNDYINIFHLVGKGVRNKRIPFELFKTVEEVGAFIDGLYMGDGCKSRTEYSIATVNEFLAFQIKSALLMLGKYSILRKVKQNPRDLYDKVREVTYHYEQSYFYSVIWRQSDSPKVSIGFFKNKNFWHYASIEKIEEERKVYDLQVENSHTYNANGIIIHNCFSCHTTTNIYKLISQLKNISYREAVQYIDNEIEVEQAPLNNLQNRNIETIEQQVLDKSTKKFFNTIPLLNPEDYEYTKLRGFTFDFCNEFDIQLAVNGFYKDYLIIPIRNKYYNLDTFEARKICQLQYLQKWFESRESLPILEKRFSELKELTHIKIKNGVIVDKDGLTSTNPILYYLLKTKVLYEPNSPLKSILWNIDNLDYNKDVIICEGLGSIPKIYQNYSTNVTCTFGSQISDAQIMLLNKFKGKKIFLSDWDSASYSMLAKIRNYVEDVFVFSEQTDDTHNDFIDKLNQGHIEVSRFLLNIFYI